MEGTVLYQAAGISGRLKYKYLEVASFGEWHLNARTREEWSVNVPGDVKIDQYAAQQYGQDLEVELTIAAHHTDHWRGRVTLVSPKPLVLKGIGAMETGLDETNDK